jgi:hypothetical protein
MHGEKRKIAKDEQGPRIMYSASEPMFATLRNKMETEWTPQMVQGLRIARADLPIIWDADFLRGEGEDHYVLCEINVSSVTPIPDQAPD